jgi:hypothetical protein
VADAKVKIAITFDRGILATATQNGLDAFVVAIFQIGF